MKFIIIIIVIIITLITLILLLLQGQLQKAAKIKQDSGTYQRQRLCVSGGPVS